MTLRSEYGSLANSGSRRVRSARSVQRLGQRDDDKESGMIDQISGILSNEESDLSVDFADIVKNQN